MWINIQRNLSQRKWWITNKNCKKSVSLMRTSWMISFDWGYFYFYSLPQRKSVSPKLTPLQRSHSCDALDKPMKAPTPPQSACGHPNAGQELCYLCHQRARRNIPVSFTEERRRREAEEDKLLQQFQYMKDAEETLKDQVWALVTLYWSEIPLSSQLLKKSWCEICIIYIPICYFFRTARNVYLHH